jgi:murein DD-endopeptidase MepM/ murein hydrolase activator NlpD
MIEFILPVSGVIIQGITQLHSGIDITCIEGSPVIAVHSGYGQGKRDYNMGNVFTLTSDDGIVTSYSHLKRFVSDGSYEVGDVIGYCGNTGRMTNGPHLHFESNQTFRFQ